MKFHDFINLLPQFDQWIDDHIEEHMAQARNIYDIGFPRIPTYFPKKRLQNTYAVPVEHIEPPPLDRFGLVEATFPDGDQLDGLTYKNVYFLKQDLFHLEAPHFHELIHVVQWHELGLERFFITYGVGLLGFSYRNSLLEAFTRELVNSFKAGDGLPNLEGMIRSHCREISQSII